jgi:peptide/nickel transport system substrate-binding protein
VEYRPSKYVRLVANKRYWRGAPKVDETIFQIYQNVDSMRADLQAGALQEARDLPLVSAKTLQADKDLAVSVSNPARLVVDLGFNCYTGAESKGNPVLLDPAFRRALNYAVDKEEICKVVYLGLAKPAQTVLISDYWSDPDWHWTPPAGERYTFDLEKAAAALDAAGYRDTDGDGIRDHRGKPIALRLWAIADQVDRQAAGKLIAGWFRQIGLRIKYEVMDEGALTERMYDTQGGKFAPDYDMFLWGWQSDLDPSFALSVFTSTQIGSWSDTQWSNAEYDRLFGEQQSTIDQAKRKAIIDRMQELLYRESPMIFYAEPPNVTAWNVSDWAGWVVSPEKSGATYGTEPINDSFLKAYPKMIQAESGSSPTLVVALSAIGVALVIGVVTWLVRRRRSPAEHVDGAG